MSPPSVSTVLIYLVVLLHRTNSLDRVRLARSSIRSYVKFMVPKNETCPTDDSRISCLIQGMTKCFGKPVKKKLGLTVPLVLAALQFLLKEGQNTSLFNWRTAAFLAIQFFLTARYEEVSRLLKSLLKKLDNGNIEFNFVYAKNNTDHENRLSVLSSIKELKSVNPVFIVSYYLRKLYEISPAHPLLFPKLQSGFKNKVRQTVVSNELEPVSYFSIANAYREVYKELKVEVDLSSITGTHAPRIGSASEVVKDSSISLLDVKHSGRWKNIKTPLTYLRQNPDSLCKVSKTLGHMLVKEKEKQEKKEHFKVAVEKAIEEAVGSFVF